jgi:hypothetical protein
MIEIRLPKCRVFLTEQEIESLLKHDPELWEAALKRGKVITRARQRRERQRKEEKKRA